MDPIDKSQCSFPIPDFASELEEDEWLKSLTWAQRIELLELHRIARYGEEACSRPMDKSVIEVLTMDEFRELKQREYEEEEKWRAEHGWPPLIRRPQHAKLNKK